MSLPSHGDLSHKVIGLVFKAVVGLCAMAVTWLFGVSWNLQNKVTRLETEAPYTKSQLDRIEKTAQQGFDRVEKRLDKVNDKLEALELKVKP